jgi:trans-aconitate methyltransferase
MEKVRVHRIWNKIKGHVGGHVLEVGCGIGLMTPLIAECASSLIAIDSDPACVRDGQAHAGPRVQVEYGTLEALTPSDGMYDTVVAVNVLEHVADPDECLARISSVLNPKGTVVLSVPNAYSLHRQAGVESGAIPTCTSLGPADLKVGHRRVYSVTTLTTLTCHHFDHGSLLGSYYKPFPNPVMTEVLARHPEAFAALMDVWVTAHDAADLIFVGTKR